MALIALLFGFENTTSIEPARDHLARGPREVKVISS
jgi:hypothetical protein